MGSITKGQLRKIWALGKELNMDEDLLRATVHGVTGSESISALSKYEAGKVIDNLTERKGKAKEKTTNRASKKQLWKMKRLAAQLGWEDNPKRLKGFIKKYAGVDRLEWLTSAQAWRIIEGLKKLAEREQKAQEEG